MDSGRTAKDDAVKAIEIVHRRENDVKFDAYFTLTNDSLVYFSSNRLSDDADIYKSSLRVKNKDVSQARIDSLIREANAILVELQNTICSSTNQNFNPICHDALDFDYSLLNLKKPVFFIGGLAQMGGDVLATSIIDKINSITNLKKETGIVFAGTHTKRQLSGNLGNGGWSSLIEKHDLKVIDTVSLPTIWTFDQDVETPYIYTEFK